MEQGESCKGQGGERVMIQFDQLIIAIVACMTAVRLFG